MSTGTHRHNTYAGLRERLYLYLTEANRPVRFYLILTQSIFVLFKNLIFIHSFIFVYMHVVHVCIFFKIKETFEFASISTARADATFIKCSLTAWKPRHTQAHFLSPQAGSTIDNIFILTVLITGII